MQLGVDGDSLLGLWDVIPKQVDKVTTSFFSYSLISPVYCKSSDFFANFYTGDNGGEGGGKRLQLSAAIRGSVAHNTGLCCPLEARQGKTSKRGGKDDALRVSLPPSSPSSSPSSPIPPWPPSGRGFWRGRWPGFCAQNCGYSSSNLCDCKKKKEYGKGWSRECHPQVCESHPPCATRRVPALIFILGARPRRGTLSAPLSPSLSLLFITPLPLLLSTASSTTIAQPAPITLPILLLLIIFFSPLRISPFAHSFDSRQEKKGKICGGGVGVGGGGGGG